MSESKNGVSSEPPFFDSGKGYIVAGAAGEAAPPLSAEATL